MILAESNLWKDFSGQNNSLFINQTQFLSSRGWATECRISQEYFYIFFEDKNGGENEIMNLVSLKMIFARSKTNYGTNISWFFFIITNKSEEQTYHTYIRKIKIYFDNITNFIFAIENIKT